ncbi:proline-rich protein 36-like [Alexandromys fortis]|uniref:proline-rich protein 36-like n=1 Tax=Alexandromys fortis TaxID=100897 RepID=UPI00215309B3|nr:proline-rich protein 36-like [Microtus fortis]
MAYKPIEFPTKILCVNRSLTSLARPRPRRPCGPAPAPQQSPPPAPASRRPPRPPAAACLPPRLPCPCGAAHPGRAGLASERPRSARGAGQDEQGRKGRAPQRLGPPPAAEEGPSRTGSTTARVSHTRRSARPPRLSPRQARRSCPRTPPPPRSQPPQRRRPACPPARFRPSPSCRGSAPSLSHALALPVGPANGSAPLLHKRGGGGALDGNCGAVAPAPASRARSCFRRPPPCVTSGLRAAERLARNSLVRLLSPGLAPPPLPPSCLPGRPSAR